ncbi:MAG TPA: uracil-DNA glycosylase [Fibrobacteraceae bacterium]|nr:uracil-DNA glycosylase [Fibrobacteraceae bacterium]
MAVKLESSWLHLLEDQFSQPYFLAIKKSLVEEKKRGVTVYPPGSLIFNALDLCPVEQVKVVIIGQDPYHNPQQAHGLSFSVPNGVAPPPSLLNIFKEIEDDLGLAIPPHGNLEAWARQGVLLLNASLTVRAFQAGSHANLGWTQFTDTLIQRLSSQRKNLVFMLWGNYARAKRELVTPDRGHLVLEAAHPSPFSAYKGFFGCRHFSLANDYLKHVGQIPIDWSL